MGESDRRFELNWVQSLAGALAAVTSAVLLSTVGVAGTLIGAALGSLAATVGSAVYSYYIRATQDRVTSAGTVAVTRIGHGRSRGPSTPDEAGEEVAAAGEDPHHGAALEDAKNPPAGGFTEVLAGLPWKRIAVVATGLFVAAMVVILAFELVTGRAVSSYTGGSDSDRRTSIPGLGGGRDQDDPAGDQDEPQPTPGETPSGEPDESTGETEQPTPSPTPTAETEETAVPPLTESPEETATSGYTPSPTPSPTSPATGSPPPSP
jgi:hypothetical protein